MTPEQISERMRRVKGKNTSPEMRVRRLVHRLGYRYRLHDRDLPGRPDLVFRPKRRVIFVHGCFWHQHPGCRYGALPRTRLDYWLPKLDRNRVRDRENLDALHDLGWEVMVVWECETKDEERLGLRLLEFLGRPGAGAATVA